MKYNIEIDENNSLRIEFIGEFSVDFNPNYITELSDEFIAEYQSKFNALNDLVKQIKELEYQSLEPLRKNNQQKIFNLQVTADILISKAILYKVLKYNSLLGSLKLEYVGIKLDVPVSFVLSKMDSDNQYRIIFTGSLSQTRKIISSCSGIYVPYIKILSIAENELSLFSALIPNPNDEYNKLPLLNNSNSWQAITSEGKYVYFKLNNNNLRIHLYSELIAEYDFPSNHDYFLTFDELKTVTFGLLDFDDANFHTRIEIDEGEYYK